MRRRRWRAGVTISFSCRSSSRMMCHRPKSVYPSAVDSPCDTSSRPPLSSISKSTIYMPTTRPAMTRRTEKKGIDLDCRYIFQCGAIYCYHSSPAGHFARDLLGCYMSRHPMHSSTSMIQYSISKYRLWLCSPAKCRG
jgi:hypothetical protein